MKFTPRTTPVVTTNKYWSGHPYCAESETMVGECTWYVEGRLCELLQNTIIRWEEYPNPTYRLFNRFTQPNGKNWYSESLWEKGQTPKLGAILCWWGPVGHVAVVEGIIDNENVIISDYNKIAKHTFAYRTINPYTYNGSGNFLGYIYPPIDFELDWIETTTRDTSKNQILVNTSSLRVREHAGLDQNVLGYAEKGIYDVTGKIKYDIDGYTWYEIIDNHYVAGVDGVTFYPKDQNDLEPVNEIKDYYKGIDVSEWQNPELFDFEAAKKDLDFAIIRSSFSNSSKTLKTDAQFEDFYKKFISVGIPVGIYHYSMATTVEDAKKEANYVLDCIKGKDITYPIFIDMEDNTLQAKESAQTLRAVADAFCNIISEAGYETGIYSYTAWYKTKLDMTGWKYVKWVAWYPTASQSWTPYEYKGSYDIWQYTSSGDYEWYKGGVASNGKSYSSRLDCSFSYNKYEKKNVETPTNPVDENISVDILLLEKDIKDKNQQISELTKENTSLKEIISKIKELIQSI